MLALPGDQYPTQWVREDLILLDHLDGGVPDIHRWNPRDQAPPRPYLNAPWSESQLTVSPDGRWGAFLSAEREVPEVYVREFPVPENKWRLTTGQSNAPRWSRDGRYLWWTHAGGGSGIDTVYRARVEDPARGRFGAPEAMHVGNIDGIANWDLHPDGTRFVMAATPLRGSSDPAQAVSSEPRFLITLHWVAELRRRLGEARSP